MSGKVHVLFDSIVSGLPHVKDGKLRTGRDQPEALAAGTGHPDRQRIRPARLRVRHRFGIYGPGLPAEIVNRLNAEFNKAIQPPRSSDRGRLGAEPVGGTPAQFAAMVKRTARAGAS